MSKIRIDTNTLKVKIQSLKEEKKKMDDVLENFKGESLKIDSYWSGNTGDTVKESLTGYTSQFDFISSKLEKYIYFLEKVSEAYENEDAGISKKIDSNSAINIK